MIPTLIIDADDTLWENNIYYEEAIDGFLELVAARDLPRDKARRLLTEVERRNVPLHGYGSQCFRRSLVETFELMVGEPAGDEEARIIEDLTGRIMNRPVEYLPGVERTLASLRERFRLILFSKGDLVEQQNKVERSGAALFFHHVELTTEKDERAYLHLIERYRLDPSRTWMIGNSPRSDVNPALEVGLNAILIPHPRTWELEHENIQSDHRRLRILERFEDLLQFFSLSGGRPS